MRISAGSCRRTRDRAGAAAATRRARSDQNTLPHDVGELDGSSCRRRETESGTGSGLALIARCTLGTARIRQGWFAVRPGSSFVVAAMIPAGRKGLGHARSGGKDRSSACVSGPRDAGRRGLSRPGSSLCAPTSSAGGFGGVPCRTSTARPRGGVDRVLWTRRVGTATRAAPELRGCPQAALEPRRLRLGSRPPPPLLRRGPRVYSVCTLTRAERRRVRRDLRPSGLEPIEIAGPDGPRTGRIGRMSTAATRCSSRPYRAAPPPARIAPWPSGRAILSADIASWDEGKAWSGEHDDLIHIEVMEELRNAHHDRYGGGGRAASTHDRPLTRTSGSTPTGS